MQSYYIHPWDITALKEEVQKWSSTNMFMQLLCYASQSLIWCFGLLHVLFPSPLTLGNASYRTITGFSRPLSILKAAAYVYKSTVVHSKTIKIGLQCLLEVRMAHTLAACSLWQSPDSTGPKCFIMGGRSGEQTIPHILLSQPLTLSVYLTSWRVSEWHRKEMWPVSCSGITSATVKYKQESFNGLHSGWGTVINQ